MTRFHADLIRIILAQIFLHACMAGVRVAAPLLALKNGQGALAVGLLMAMFSISQVFLSLPAGRWTDRKGLHLPVRTGIVVAVLSAALAAIWPVFPVLCLSALGTGAAVGITVISLQRHVGRMAHDEQALRAAFSWLSMGPAISNFVGPVIAGLLIDHSGPNPADLMGFRIAFGVLALMPLLTWWFVHLVPEHELRPVTNEASNQRAMDLLRSPMMQRLLLVNWIMSSCWDIHSLMIPVLGHERGFSASAVGTVLGSFAVAVALIRLLLPWLSAHVAEYRIISWAMALSCLAFCLYPFMPNAFSMGLCSVFLGFALGTIQPLVMSTLHRITPKDRQGEALGLRMMSINASSVFMPMLFGATGALIGVAPLFWLVGAGVGLGTRVAWGLQHARGHGQ